MALVNISSVLQMSLQTLKKCRDGSGVALYSYKRNRKILVVKQARQYLLREDGYRRTELHLSAALLKKELASSIKREFPRSRKVRFYTVDSIEEFEKPYQKI